MCGRYTLVASRSDLEARFDVDFAGHEMRYNCAPGQDLPVVTAGADVVRPMQWGLIPSWSDDGSDAFINARAETVAEKRSFEAAYERRRCLVPADGFYEWAERDGEKRPYRVAFEDDRPFAMAGLWERWTPRTTQTGLDDFGASGSSTADPIETFTVVTTEPNDVVEPLHHRMAVVLPPAAESTWLHGDPAEVSELMAPHPGSEMHAYPVSPRVNSHSNDDPSLLDDVSA